MFRKLSFLMAVVLALSLAMPAVATDYYLDAVNGDDDNGDGSFGDPWKSFKNITSYYQASYRPPGWVDIQPGDTIYLMDGTYNELVYYGGSTGPETNGPYVACWRFEDGSEGSRYHIKAYPGHSPVLDAQYGGMGIYIWQSSWWEIDGLEIKNSAARGILIAGNDQIEIHNVYIHEVSGEGGQNNAGIHINGCDEVEIYDSTLEDNLATGNSSNITHFQGTNITIHDCDFSHPVSGPCVKYKHASNVTTAYFHVYNNTFSDCSDFSFGAATYNTHFHHNLVVGGGSWAIMSQDFGGYTHQTNLTFEYNTVYDAPAVSLNVVDTYTDPENINFNNNIFYDTATSYGGWGIVAIGHYNSDYLLNLVEPELSFNDNCYCNPNISVQFDFGASSSGGDAGPLGGLYTLSEWQTEYGYDLSSLETDPLFVDAENGDFHLQGGSPCEDMGIYAGLGPTPPGQASNPSPADSATDVSVDADLSWTAGSGSTSSDVYFGTDSTPDAGEFQGNQTATTYDPGTMANSTTYYWRIDEINAEGTTTGDVWSFTTEAAPQPPGQASNPSPADSATDVSITANLSWTAGSGATSSDVYFGTDATPDAGEFQGNQTATTYDPGTMANDTTYYL